MSVHWREYKITRVRLSGVSPSCEQDCDRNLAIKFGTQLPLNILKEIFWTEQPEIAYAHARQLIDCAVHFGCNKQ